MKREERTKNREQRTMSNEKLAMNNEKTAGRVVNTLSWLTTKLFIVHCSLLIIICLSPIVFSSCRDPFTAVQPEQRPGMGYVTLSVEAAAGRTVMPTMPALDSYALHFTKVDNAAVTVTENRSNDDLGEPVYLEPGTYRLTVDGKHSGGAVVARGEADGTLTIIAGSGVSAYVSLYPITENATGHFSWNITLPAGLATATMTIEPLNGGAAQPAINLHTTAAGSTDLDAAYYQLTVDLTQADTKPIKHLEALHIYGNLTSNFSFTFTEDHFQSVTYTVTYNYNDGQSEPAAQTVYHIGYSGSDGATPDIVPQRLCAPQAGLYRGKEPFYWGFEGWYSADNAPYHFGEIVLNDFTLTAQWSDPRINVSGENGNNDVAQALAYVNAHPDTYTLFIGDDVQLAPQTFNAAGTDITLKTTLNAVTISLSDTGSLFTIEDGVSLTLEEGVTLRGMDDNDASLVYVGGTFTMNGGEISGNHNYVGGGGVYVYEGGTFIMNGGTISNNEATNGGGVCVAMNATFTMDGGKISDNTAGNIGGGVSVYESTFTMSGGTISENTAGNSGGGVDVGGGTFTMSGGEISDNNVTSSSGNGGGVFVSTYSDTFNLGGRAVIKDNTQGSTSTTANNVYLASGHYITLLTGASAPAPDMEVWVRTVSANNGVIVNSGATADIVPYFRADNGKGLYVNNSGQLVISGASNVTVDNGSSETGHPTLAAALDSITTAGTYTVRIFTNHSTPPGSLGVSGADINITLIAPVNSVDNPVTVSLASAGNLFTINSGVSLTLEEGVTLQGLNTNNVSLVNVINGGIFTMNGGKINGNASSLVGGGVYINGGTFAMNGGEISNNTAVDAGGGVSVSGGTFTMNKGVIKNNSVLGFGGTATGGGGVSVGSNSIFTMNGGEISDNTVPIDSVPIGTSGGGVDVRGANSIFNMHGGTISRNTAGAAGGGVLLYNGGTFTMTNGTINENKANTGGGVCVGLDNTTFTMNGGKIINNTSSTNGGGVIVDSSGIFTMSGGEISNNSASGEAGGGVYVNGGRFTMNHGKISDNNAGESGRGGGGVGINGSTFTMSGGEISGNTAYINGGGVSVIFNGRFIMSGGVISGNKTLRLSSGFDWGYGGGVCLEDSTFTMSGGEISGNSCNNDRGGGGVCVGGNLAVGSTFNLGGTAVIRGNTKDTDPSATNVFLQSEKSYITLLTDDSAPADGMAVGVHTERTDGVIVQTGATAGMVGYFFADEGGKSIIHSNGQLVIVDEE